MGLYVNIYKYYVHVPPVTQFTNWVTYAILETYSVHSEFLKAYSVHILPHVGVFSVPTLYDLGTFWPILHFYFLLSLSLLERYLKTIRYFITTCAHTSCDLYFTATFICDLFFIHGIFMAYSVHIPSRIDIVYKQNNLFRPSFVR